MNKLSNILSKEDNQDIDYKTINNIKALAIDMIDVAQSGHPGIVLSAAPIIYTLYGYQMNFDIKNDKWINRDRFVMSAGHGSALLYATLFMCSFNLSIDDLKQFRKIDSKTPGHPEYMKTPGVDMTTGPLGQGFASAVGMAIAEKFLNNRYTYRKGKSIIDHFTYVLCSDGDLMEGISYESASIAGNLGLGKLIVLYDSNDMTLDTNTTDTFKENIIDRFKALNWDTQFVKNGNDIMEINNAINKAKEALNKPSIIEIKTIIGNGSKLENTSKVHSKPLTEDDIEQLKRKLEIRDIKFTLLNDAITHMRNLVNKRNNPVIKLWNNNYNSHISKLSVTYQEELQKQLLNILDIDYKKISLESKKELNDSPRNLSSHVLNDFIDKDILMLGGSADVSSSTRTYLTNMGNFTNINSTGRNILFGVREHAMGAILNGITLSGIRCFGSTFLTFSDYLKPSIRMAAIMKLPVLYVFTHDSILVGEDGPTHQPVEQLIGLRSIPNVTLYRPCDANEVIGSYKSALKNTIGPSVIVLGKDIVKPYKITNINFVDKGGYIVKKFAKPMGLIIATGKELEIAITISDKLEKINIFVNVVSMPSIERFFLQEKSYQNKVLPKIKRLVIEFGSPYSWYKFVRSNKNIISINKFGKSGKKSEIEEEYNLTIEKIYQKAYRLFK